MSKKQWEIDLAWGQEIEAKLRDWLAMQPSVVSVEVPTVAEQLAGAGDVRWTTQSGRVREAEVKAHRAKFNTAFIEITCGTRNSGISRTKAEWWINYFEATNEFIMCSTADLKAAILPLPLLGTQTGAAGKSITISALKNLQSARVLPL